MLAWMLAWMLGCSFIMLVGAQDDNGDDDAFGIAD
jgi:hypothetical protein